MKLSDAIEIGIWTATYAERFEALSHGTFAPHAPVEAAKDAGHAVAVYRLLRREHPELCPEPPTQEPVTYAEHAQTARGLMRHRLGGRFREDRLAAQGGIVAERLAYRGSEDEGKRR